MSSSLASACSIAPEATGREGSGMLEWAAVVVGAGIHIAEFCASSAWLAGSRGCTHAAARIVPEGSARGPECD